MVAPDPSAWRKNEEGKWVPGTLKIDGGLAWESGDSSPSENVLVKLDESIDVKEVQFGLRKHVFVIDSHGVVRQFACVDDAARTAWVALVSKEAGLPAPKKTSEEDEETTRKGSVRGLQNLLQGLPGGGSLGGGLLSPGEAQRKLREKLRGRVDLDTTEDEQCCFVCLYRVDPSERAELPDGKGIVHAACYFCSACGATVDKDTVTVGKKNIWCQEHAHLEPVEESSEDNISASRSSAIVSAIEIKNMLEDADSRGTDEVLAEAPPKRSSGQGLNHNAVLSRPSIQRQRRPRAQPQRQAIPFIPVPIEVDDAEKEVHENCFHLFEAPTSFLFFFGFLAEKRKWFDAITNAAKLVNLDDDLAAAQRVDMFSAIQATVNIENFQKAHQSEMNGAMRVCIRRAIKDKNCRWIPAFGVLENKVLTVYSSEGAAKKKIASAEVFQVNFKDKPLLWDGQAASSALAAEAAKPQPKGRLQPSAKANKSDKATSSKSVKADRSSKTKTKTPKKAKTASNPPPVPTSPKPEHLTSTVHEVALIQDIEADQQQTKDACCIVM
mmetsp:Transcript_11443/g.21190  ORF Transcript_11443/g.21190 Transcript_11443/m.21190 type:complete len:552 (-) Transcript_11443:98-1753(-)